MPELQHIDDPGELTDSIEVDMSLIPEHHIEALVAPLYENVVSYFQQPGVQERFDKWREARISKNG